MPLRAIPLGKIGNAQRGVVKRQVNQRAMKLLWEPSGDYTPGMLFSLNEVSYGLRNENWADGTAFKHEGRRLVVHGGFLRDCHRKIVLAVKSLGR